MSKIYQKAKFSMANMAKTRDNQVPKMCNSNIKKSFGILRVNYLISSLIVKSVYF